MTKTFEDIINEDVFDLRDVIERREELDAEHEALFDAANEEGASEAAKQAFIDWQSEEGGECSERASIISFMDEVKGCGGDEQFEGDWYPLTFIRDGRAFTDEMQRLVEECDLGLAHDKSLPFYIVIDWEGTADNLRVDYSSVEIEGKTFWYR